MKNDFNLRLGCIFFSLFIVSCASDSTDDLIELDLGATVSYVSDVQPILNTYGCLGCHSGGDAEGGIRLDTRMNVQTNIGAVLDAIKRNPRDLNFMPQGGEKMAAADIAIIQEWADSGFPE